MKNPELLKNYLKVKEENIILKEKLSAKKYILIDGVISRFYKIFPFILYLRTKRINKNNDSRSKKNIKEEKSERRKIKKNKVYIINYRFYDYKGEVVYRGGAERYVYDLSVLLKKLGYKPTLLQLSDKNFEKEFKGVKIIGIEAPEYTSPEEASKIYNDFCRDAEFIIASPMELAVNIENIPVISINHGVNFDTPFNNIRYTIENNVYIKSIANSDFCVCVDTNFINWVRTSDYYFADNLIYIPNYCDDSFFNKKREFNNEKILCIYPRRIYSARGHDITIEAFEKLLKKQKNLMIHFVGQIHDEEAEIKLNSLIKKYPKQVKQYSVEPEEMFKTYKDADIAIIPTRYSEGTSLSCIEALASGCAVVATNVGGLPNIIIDHHNGLLISPNAISIKKAIEELINNRSLMNRLSKNGVESAKNAFNKKLWDEKWTEIINKIIK